MDLIDYFSAAIHAFWSNKKRTMLTSLGVIVGMCSVIMLNTIGTYINNTLENLVYTIVSGNKMVVEIIPAAGNVPDYDEQGNIIIPESQLISPEKLQEVEQNYMGDVEQIIELPSLAYYTNNADGNEMIVALSGVSSAFFEARSIENAEGKAIGKRDCLYGSECIYLEESFANDHFNGSAIGKSIQITDYNGSLIEFTVIGTYKSENTSSKMTQAYIPYTYAFNKLGVEPAKTSMAEFIVPNGTDIKKMAAEVKHILRDNNRTSDWEIKTTLMTDEINSMRTFVTLISSIVTVIASISLLVGGIGIMNIMIVSVTERTNEIGVRKACGASPKEIRIQFILEAFIMTLFGTIIGTVLGLYISKTLLVILYCVLGDPTIETKITISPVLIGGAALYSIVVGIVCGLVPAEKAIKMNLVSSLSFE